MQVLPLTLSIASAGQTKIFDKDVVLTLFLNAAGGFKGIGATSFRFRSAWQSYNLPRAISHAGSLWHVFIIVTPEALCHPGYHAAALPSNGGCSYCESPTLRG